jgi:hypothetical protein
LDSDLYYGFTPRYYIVYEELRAKIVIDFDSSNLHYLENKKT